MAATVNKKTET